MVIGVGRLSGGRLTISLLSDYLDRMHLRIGSLPVDDPIAIANELLCLGYSLRLHPGGFEITTNAVTGREQQ